MNILSLPFNIVDLFWIFGNLIITAIGAYFLYVLFFRILRVTFRKLEKDIALVTLNVSAYPALLVFVLICLKLTFNRFEWSDKVNWLDKILLGAIIVATTYWMLQLFSQVVIYYLKEYAETTEAMWDNVLVPLLEGVIPIIIIIIGSSLLIQFCLGINLTGIWLTLGGAGFVVGFAVKDILANFFSGIVLLIDSPFQFNDVLRFENESGSKSSLGILKKIGVRVTHLYMFESHTEVYIPNSVMQSQKITNLSRPIEPVYFSTPIIFRPDCDLEQVKRVMKEIIQAHPDTLGTIDVKLECLDKYFNWDEDECADDFEEKKERGKARLEAENEVNMKLDEIEAMLEALMVTLQFAEKGGLNQDEIETVQEEFKYIMDLIGVEIITRKVQKTKLLLPFFNILQNINLTSIEENSDEDTLIVLVREWYRIWLEDPHVVYQDQYVLPEIWERKIDLLKKRVHRLYQKISNPYREETRLDDYVMELRKWLHERFKQARSEWQEPEIRMERLKQDEGYTYVEFSLNYYVDDIRLEDGERGIRVNSDLHREIMRHLKQHCLSRGLSRD
jgi:MscS family membrane protein